MNLYPAVYGSCAMGLFLGLLAACSQSSSDVVSKPAPNPDPQAPAFFDREPFIHPTIIEAFAVWMSDSGDQVVAINLDDAQGSNRFFGDVVLQAGDNDYPRVMIDRGDDGFFAYSLVGQTDSGAFIVATAESGGGSGVFRSLKAFRLIGDYGIGQDSTKNHLSTNRPRTLLYYLGSIPLGDRWSGDLQVQGNELHIGVDEGWFSGNDGHGHGPRSQISATQIIRLDF
ncbi:MAG: hypothetical protein EA402_14330 [Planctomycetota bacterium]|nr:MAG: hypothetical protein EA402_14330 [Planctomycetota bacterium]